MSPETTPAGSVQPETVEPAVAGLARPLGAVFGAVARLRSGPPIHKVGTTYRAELDVTGSTGSTETGAGLPMLDEPRTTEVIVRLSRGAGFPHTLPDALGLAIRLSGEKGPQDLLLDSCGAGRFARHALRLGRDVSHGPYGTLIAYRTERRLLHLAAFGEGHDDEATGPAGRDHDEASGCRFRLAWAEPFEPEWHTWAHLTLLEPVPRPELRFSPANDGLGLRMRTDWLAFRRSSYETSQRDGPRDGRGEGQQRPADQVAARKPVSR